MKNGTVCVSYDNLTLSTYVWCPKWGQEDIRNDTSRLYWHRCHPPYRFRCWARIRWCLRSPCRPLSRSPSSTRRKNGHRSHKGCPRLLRLSSSTPNAESLLAGCSRSDRLSFWSSKSPSDCLKSKDQNPVYIYIYFIYTYKERERAEARYLKLFVPMQMWPVLSRMYPGEHSHS